MSQPMESTQLEQLTQSTDSQSHAGSLNSISTTSAQHRRHQSRLGARRNTRDENGPARGSRGAFRSWTRDFNQDGRSSLDLIVEWLTIEGNYSLWRSGQISKRDAAERIGKYLVEHGAEHRDWRGIEQQVTTLEKKFRTALAWKEQTGQGILDEAEELTCQAGGDANESDAENLVELARNQTEAAIQKKCKYFFELEPIMRDRPSSIPLNLYEPDSLDTGLADTLNLGGTHHQQTTLDHINSQAEDRMETDRDETNESPSTLLNCPTNQGQLASPGSDFSSNNTPPQLQPSSQPQRGRSQGQSQHRPNYAERITDRIFPTREEMMAQSNAELTLNQNRLQCDMRMVDANVELAAAFRRRMDANTNNQEHMALQLEQLRLDVQHRQIQIAREHASLRKLEEESTGPFARARMVQEFLRSGLSLAEALDVTTRFLGSESG